MMTAMTMAQAVLGGPYPCPDPTSRGVLLAHVIVEVSHRCLH